MATGAVAKQRRAAHAEWFWQACLGGRREVTSLKYVSEHHASFEVRDRARAMHDQLPDRRETLIEKRRRVLKTVAPPKEAELVLAVLRDLVKLQQQGVPLSPIRVPVDSMPVAPGAPDLVVLFDDGRSLLIELKRKGNKLTRKQRTFRDAATGLGHRYEVVEVSTRRDAIAQVWALVGCFIDLKRPVPTA